MSSYRISKLAEQAGVSVHVVRDYLLRGLLHPVRRTDSGYGIFDAQSLERLRFVRTAFEAGTGFDRAGLTAEDIAAQLHDRPGHQVPVQLATAQVAGHPHTACTPAFFTICRLARLRSNRRADRSGVQGNTCHIPRPALEPHAPCITAP